MNKLFKVQISYKCVRNSYRTSQNIGVVALDVVHAIDLVKHKYRNEIDVFISAVNFMSNIDIIDSAICPECKDDE